MSAYLTFTLGLLTGSTIMLIAAGWFKGKYQAQKYELKLLKDSLKERQATLERLQEENLRLVKSIATLDAQKASLEKTIQNHQQEAKDKEEKLSLQFNKLANELLKQGSDKLVVQNKSQMEGLLNPLKEKITSFEKQVTRTHEETLARNVALRTELNKINTLNLQMAQEAKNLTNAIKGDTKMTGDMGEFSLQRLLQASGLEKNREYFIQESFTTDEGKRYRPDVVIKLPNNKHIIIDSKVSLLHYERFYNIEDVEEKNAFLKKHVLSIKTHIKELSKKDYPQKYSLQGGIDFTLMFIPIEHAFSLAAQNSPGLFYETYQQNIVLVTPSNLMTTLRMIAHIWKTEDQNRNALEIAHYSGALFDKFVSFVENIKKIGTQLNTTQKTYDTAMKQLSEGKGNLIDKVQRLKQLGARTNKNLISS